MYLDYSVVIAPIAHLEVEQNFASFLGETLYHESVAPVFALCGISTEVIVTKAFGEVVRTC